MSTVNFIESADERAKPPARNLQNDPRNRDDTELGENFVSALDAKMKAADMANFKRGSDEYFDIENDLEKLSKQSYSKAAELWEKNTPPETPKPFYIDPNREEAPTPSDTAKKSPESDPLLKNREAKETDEYELPLSIQKRYLATENKFYFRDAENKLAFEDRGRHLVTEHNDQNVAGSMVELASAKGWSKIKVSGHDDFKREVWLQASLKGLEVSGFKPKDVDLAKLEEMRDARIVNTVERDSSRTRQAPDSPKDAPLTSASSNRSRSNAPVSEPITSKAELSMSGKLLEHGPAPYNFDATNQKNYYVKLETAAGEKTHWGVDLQRAMKESNVQVGDKVELEYRGRQPVTVQQKEYDAKGNVTGTKEIETHRNEWRASLEGAIREKSVQDAPAKAPELKGDYKVVSSVMADVLREKGYSPKTIEKAMHEAGKRLEAQQVAGQPAPAVKAYDKGAPRQKAVRVKVKTQEKEVERSR